MQHNTLVALSNKNFKLKTFDLVGKSHTEQSRVFFIYMSNYIELINGFWKKSEDDDLTSGDVSVYFALLNYANRLSWKNPFICHWDIVCNNAKVSKNTYYKSMERLSELGYIKFELGKKNVSKPKVFILNFKNRKGIKLRTTLRTELEQNEEQNEEQKGNIDKPINLKTIKPINLETTLEVPPQSVATPPKKKKRLFSEVTMKDFEEEHQQYFWLAKGFYDVFMMHAIELGLPKKSLNQANADEWTKQIRLMIETNEATEAQLIEVGKFLKKDNFWKTNVRSVPKLREKFETIYSQLKKPQQNGQPKSTLEDPEFQAMVMAKFAAGANRQGTQGTENPSFMHQE